MKRLVVIVAALALALFRPSACSRARALEASPVSVQLVSPASGSVVSNTISLSVLASTAAPGAAIYKVEFYVDGKLIGAVTNRPTAPAIRITP